MIDLVLAAVKSRVLRDPADIRSAYDKVPVQGISLTTLTFGVVYHLQALAMLLQIHGMPEAARNLRNVNVDQLSHIDLASVDLDNCKVSHLLAQDNGETDRCFDACKGCITLVLDENFDTHLRR